MPERFEPKTAILPKAQQEIWSLLASSVGLSYVLYGGTAVVLYLGHRASVDFDFFRSAPLDKRELETSFEFIRGAQTVEEDINTLVVMARMPSGSVKVSFFGGMNIGRINELLQTADAKPVEELFPQFKIVDIRWGDAAHFFIGVIWVIEPAAEA